MTSNELREKFIKFFEARGHCVIPSSSLVPENDPTVLFTTAGMQQFKRFYLFPDEAPSARVVTCQKCVRTGDIDEVGDETHLTFFEMLGNFSFGYKTRNNAERRGNNAEIMRNDAEEDRRPYFKEEAIRLAWEFLTEELEIDKSRIYATYFKDEESGVPEDIESFDFLQKIDGLSDIRSQGFDDNFWSLGTENSPGGPTVEFYVYPERSRGVDGLPSEALAKDGVEIWNLVFNEFVLKNGKYEPTELKGVDTGMGLERLAAMIQGKSDVYETDLFGPIIRKIEEFSGKKYQENKKEFRIIADHIKAAVFMVADGVEPSNKDRGYVLRRLIRRVITQGFRLNINRNYLSHLIEIVAKLYEGTYQIDVEKVSEIIDDEEKKFGANLKAAILEIDSYGKHKTMKVDGGELFYLYQSRGLPLEVGLEEIRRRNIELEDNYLEEFTKLAEEHQELSRTASAGMFKGGLADNKVETTRLHTAAHLLLSALKKVLGDQVEQKGSNITEERLRFDFNNPEKLTPEQIAEIEKIVNDKIAEALPVTMQEMNLDEAKKSDAHGTFDDRYGNKVKVYSIGNPDNYFSVEICGGPHVSNTSELGHFKIVKEESSSAGIRRIKAVLE